MFTDIIKLGFGHNLVVPNTPSKVGIKGLTAILEKESKAAIESYGLFESSSPNYTTYYPDVTPAELTPADAEFITPTFRALSEVTVHKNWNPVDFSKNGVLRKSQPLLMGQTVNVDHETMTGNAIGAVSEVSWQNSYKTANGIIVPAGINSVLKIDGKSNPRLARAINMDPPAIHSTSVTVQFAWEQSHAVSSEEFYRNLGSYDKDGQMYRRIATKIQRYHEISLVGHGADPFAQKINSDGEINNPLWADVTYNSEEAATKRKTQKYFFFDFKELETLSNEESTIPEDSNNENISTQNSEENKPSMNPFLLFLAEKFGVSVEGKTEEALTAELTEKVTAVGNIAELSATITQLNQQITAKDTEITNLKATQPNADITALTQFKTSRLTEKRAEVVRLCNLVMKNPATAITDVIANADYNTLIALELQYNQQVEQKFPLSCKKCGSEEVNRASTERNAEDKGDTKEPKDLSAFDVASELAAKKNSNMAGTMH